MESLLAPTAVLAAVSAMAATSTQNDLLDYFAGDKC
jgi:hypothetical protein